jgi:4-hydroxy-2-oxoglutarate aldolase
MATNTASVLRPGVYAPVLTPFKKDGSEDIDYVAFKIGVARLARAGVGLVLSGTLGEGSLLDRFERRTIISVAKDTLRESGLDGRIPIIAGISGGSTKECVLYANEAAESGADAA